MPDFKKYAPPKLFNMLNIKELWIGERLIYRPDGRTGTYEGAVTVELVKVKIDEHMMLLNIKDLDLAPEEDYASHKPLWDDPPFKTNSLTFQNAPDTLDLHIEVLAPALTRARPELILTRQKKAFEDFINTAIRLGLSHVKIIHGKGEGVLRSEIRYLLAHKFKAKIIIPSTDDGSTEAWLH